MNNKQKIGALEEIVFGKYDWMESYKKTFNIKDGIGLPSGMSGAEAITVFSRRVLQNKPVCIITFELTSLEAGER